jgi:hypothetical protein
MPGTHPPALPSFKLYSDERRLCHCLRLLSGRLDLHPRRRQRESPAFRGRRTFSRRSLWCRDEAEETKKRDGGREEGAKEEERFAPPKKGKDFDK